MRRTEVRHRDVFAEDEVLEVLLHRIRGGCGKVDQRAVDELADAHVADHATLSGQQRRVTPGPGGQREDVVGQEAVKRAAVRAVQL